MIVDSYYQHFIEGEWKRTLLTIATLITGLVYFCWRVTVLNYQAPVFSLLFLFAELFGFVILFLSVFTFWKVRPLTVGAPPSNVSVDIFITTLNEPEDIVRLTAVAAKAISYPHTTYILDDGAREHIRELAENLGCEYISRESNQHAKAGNVNNALAHSSGDFILILDADHVPQTWFLDHTLGYFSDPQVALVQSPQDYFTTNAFQFRSTPSQLWHDQTLFYQIGQIGRNYWNATTFCGTNAVIRRSALQNIGGIATETITEDMHTSVRLQKNGYRTIYHPESLAFGIAASDYVEFLQQRLRWGHGNVEVLKEENLPFCDNLSWPQKICYTVLGINYFEGWSRLVLYVTPALVLLTGLAPLGDTELFLWFFLPYFISAILLIIVIGRGSSRIISNERLAMARFPIYLLATAGLFIKRRYWRITAKQRGGLVPAYLLFPQITIFTLNVSALIVAAVNPPLLLIDAMSGGTLLIIIFWAVYISWLSGITIIDILVDGLKRPSLTLPLDLPAELVTADLENYNYRTLEISADTIIVSRQQELDPNSIKYINLYLPEGRLTVPVNATIETTTAVGSFSFTIQWRSVELKDALDRQLHACTWHRLISHPQTYPIVSGRQIQWQAIAVSVENTAHLALIEPAPTAKKYFHCILFADISLNEVRHFVEKQTQRQYSIDQSSVNQLWPGAILASASLIDASQISQ